VGCVRVFIFLEMVVLMGCCLFFCFVFTLFVVLLRVWVGLGGWCVWFGVGLFVFPVF